MGGVCNESANFTSVMSTDAGYERCGVGGFVANGTFLAGYVRRAMYF
jgi:hypothetical protein